ncbi:MAG: carbohydrate-binding domain-containing protein, partial [Huintestinicola sp.]
KSEGSISISGGEFSLSAFGDGIQCDGSMEITSGSFDITTGGGSALAPQSNRGFGRDTSWDMDDESSISTKGIKCSGNMVISGGNYTIDSYDDAFHSDSSISISGGTMEITAGDDAVHADISLEVSAGKITASKCTEGLEANKLTINGGDISITSSDDGFNAYGGQSSMGFGGGGKTTSEQPELNINGGNIYICAGGDGLDSNGNLTLNGGTVVVDGPSDSGNGAIDVGTESGGKAIVNGGTIIAVGSSGMAETFDGSSKQYSFMCNLSSSFEAGTEITVSVGGKALFTHTSAKSGNSVVFSCPELKDGDVCTVKAGDISEEITLSGISTSAGQGGFGGFGKGQGGFGRKELPEGFDPSEKPEMPDGMTPPDNRERPQDMTPPDNGEMPDEPGGKMPSGNTEEQVNL